MFDFIFSDIQLWFPQVEQAVAGLLAEILIVWEGIVAIIMMMAKWQLFKKFGEKPWKSIIPFCSTYILFKSIWNKRVAWIYLIASKTFDYLFHLSKKLAGVDPTNAWVTGLLLIAVPFAIVSFYCNILSCFRMAECFGKGTKTGIGLIFFYTPIIAVLGFGEAEYNREDGQKGNGMMNTVTQTVLTQENLETKTMDAVTDTAIEQETV